MQPYPRQIDRVRLALLIPALCLALGACSSSNDDDGEPGQLLDDTSELPDGTSDSETGDQTGTGTGNETGSGTGNETGNENGNDGATGNDVVGGGDNDADSSTEGEPDQSGTGSDEGPPAELLERLQNVFDAATAQALEPVVPVAGSLRALYRNGVGDERFTLTGSRMGTGIRFDNDTGAPYLAFDCIDGGNVEANVGTATGFVDQGKYEFDDCVVGPITLDGTITESPNTSDAASGLTGFVLQGFSYADSRDDTVRETTGAPGAVDMTTALDEPLGLRSVRVSFDSITIRSTAPTTYYEATDVSTDIVPPTPTEAGVQLTTRLSVRFAPDGSYASVQTVEPLQRPADAMTFTSGTLLITGDDYVMTVDADGGDPASFILGLEQDGVRTAWTVAWSDVAGFEPFDPQGIDPGF